MYDDDHGHIKSFGRHFVRHAQASDYPEELWKSTYCSLLKGMAQNISAMYDEQNPGATFTEMRSFVEGLLSKEQDHTAKIRFTGKERKEGQGIIEHVAELTSLAYQAYGQRGTTWTPEQIQEQVLDVFLRNTKGELGRRLRIGFPKTLDEATELARNLELEGYKETDKVDTVAYINGNNGNFRGKGRGSYRGQRQQNQQQQKDNDGDNVERRSCHYCGIVGHLQKNCFKKQRENGQSSNRGGKRNGRNGGRPNKSQNKSSGGQGGQDGGNDGTAAKSPSST